MNFSLYYLYYIVLYYHIVFVRKYVNLLHVQVSSEQQIGPVENNLYAFIKHTCHLCNSNVHTTISSSRRHTQALRRPSKNCSAVI